MSYETKKIHTNCGYTAAVACIPPQLSGNQPDVPGAIVQPGSLEKKVSVVVKDNKVYVETPTLSAVN